MSAAASREATPVDDVLLPVPVDVAAATEETLVDIVLGLPGVASRVLPVHGILELGRLSPIALAERTDVGLPEATRLAAAFEVGRRLQAARAQRPRRIRTPRDAARLFHSRLAPLVHEELWIAALDARDGVRGIRMLCRGGIGNGLVRTADVLRAALDMAAVKFVLVHNHPSGDPTPTLEDIDLTTAVDHAARFIGIEMKCHVVVAPGARWIDIVERARQPHF